MDVFYVVLKHIANAVESSHLINDMLQIGMYLRCIVIAGFARDRDWTSVFQSDWLDWLD